MIEKYKRGGINNVIVKMGNIYKAGSGVLGLDGKEIILGDADYSKEKHANTCGKVILTPMALSKKPLYGISPGIPSYGPIRLPEADIEAPHDAVYSRPMNKYKFINDIVPEIQVDDKIYVQWTAIFDKRNLIAQDANKRSFIFRVPYEQVICVVREGKIIPIGSNVLIDPIWESWDSILRPTFYPFNGPDGKPAVRPKKEWLAVKASPKTVDREGIIAHIGTPLRGEKCVLKPGMKVLYKPKLQNVLDIEGNKYFIVPQNKILLYKN